MKTKITICMMLIVSALLSIKTNAQSTGNNNWAAGDFLGYTQTANNLNFGFGAGPTTYMTLTPAGLLGIGTASPTNLFEVSDTKTATYSATGALTASSQLVNSNNSGNLQYSSLGFAVCSQTSGSWASGWISLVQPNSGKNGNFTFTLRNTLGSYGEIMRIQSDGTVGIGTTSPTSMLSVGNSSQFQVNSTGNIVSINNVVTSFPSSQGSSGTFLQNNGTGTLSWAAISGLLSGGTTNYIPKWTSATTLSSISLLYDNGTDVGINTATPNDVLEVNGNISVTGGGVTGVSNINGRKTSGNLDINGNTSPSNGAAVQLFGNTGSYPGYLQLTTGTNGHFEFYNYNGSTWQDLMEILPNGNVGIGTTTPNNLLQVANLVNFDNTNGNTFLGYQIGLSNVSGTGQYNTAMGYNALYSNTEGQWNTAIGLQALYHNNGNGTNTNGYANTAVGGNALSYNTTGTYNTGVGVGALMGSTTYYQTGTSNTATGNDALFSNSTGSYNTATGGYSLYGNTTGSNNTATGQSALSSNIGGNENSAFGMSALQGNNTGNYNSAFGWGTLVNNVSGSDNTAVGEGALSSNTNSYNAALGSDAGIADAGGSYNTYLGYQAGTYGGSGPYTNATALGWQTQIFGSNEVVIGNGLVTWVGTMGNSTWQTGSDARIKDNVQENVPGLSFILKLRPVTYNFDVQKENNIRGITDTTSSPGKYAVDSMLCSGFIAQEVETAANSIGYKFSGLSKPKNAHDIYTLGYASFVVPLVKAVQEQQKKIDSLKSSDSLNTVQIGKQAVLINSLLNHQKTTDSLITVLQNCCATGSKQKTLQNDTTGQENALIYMILILQIMLFYIKMHQTLLVMALL